MSDEAPDGIRLSVSYSRKVNLGNYQSADYFISASNIELGATISDIEASMETADLALDTISKHLTKKIHLMLEKRKENAQATQAAQSA